MPAIQRGAESRVYNEIGKTYTSTRAPEPLIAAQIIAALGDSQSVLNVGAGTGSYEPEDRLTVALEPSKGMIDQRKPNAAPVICGVAKHIPFADNSFDATMAILTLHHWKDQTTGLLELKRVARKRIIILTFDPVQSEQFWLIRDYFPGVKDLDRAIFQDPVLLAEQLNGGRVETVMIPSDCRDGFLCAYWKRPEAYLDPLVRAGISCFPALPRDDLDAGLAALEADLKSGRWTERNHNLLSHETMDFGYRLIVAELS